MPRQSLVLTCLSGSEQFHGRKTEVLICYQEKSAPNYQPNITARHHVKCDPSPMKFSLILVITFCAQFWVCFPGFAEEDGDNLTKEEWQAQVDRARQRVEQIRREGKFVDQEDQSRQEIDREIAKRALDDEALRPGDVVSTESGFVRFEGLTPDNKRIFVPVDTGLNRRSGSTIR
jgi:hypothetical protein